MEYFDFLFIHFVGLLFGAPIAMLSAILIILGPTADKEAIVEEKDEQEAWQED
jgi:hypothetical protein